MDNDAINRKLDWIMRNMEIINQNQVALSNSMVALQKQVSDIHLIVGNNTPVREIVGNVTANLISEHFYGEDNRLLQGRQITGK